MELPAATVEAYIREAYRQVVDVAHRVGDERLNVRPLGPQTNAVGALTAHCLGVLEFWLGHVALGRPSDRDRDGEFRTELTVAEVRARVAAALDQAGEDLRRIEAGESDVSHPWAVTLAGGGSDASILLHVIEETYQHLGHMELAADALLRDGDGGPGPRI